MVFFIILMVLGIVGGIIDGIFDHCSIAETIGHTLMFIAIAFLIWMVISGFCGIIVGAIAEPTLIETNEYEIAAGDTYAVRADLTESAPTYKLRTGIIQKEAPIKHTFITEPTDGNKLIEYKYDFANPIVRDIFWNPYDTIYELQINKYEIEWIVN